MLGWSDNEVVSCDNTNEAAQCYLLTNSLAHVTWRFCAGVINVSYESYCGALPPPGPQTHGSQSIYLPDFLFPSLTMNIMILNLPHQRAHCLPWKHITT